MILINVFDGLRPDQITPQNMPNLYGVAQRGVNFLNHHSTFPTHTRVNVGSLFTGCYPGRHGIVGNTMYLPDLDPTWRISTGSHANIQRLEKSLEGKFVTAKSLGEILAERVMKMLSVGVGSSGNAFLHNHKAASNGGIVIHPEFTVPESLQAELTERFGSWPEEALPNEPRIERAVTMLLDYLIPKYQPDVLILWMSDPDHTQHNTTVGSPVALDSIRKADAQFGRILDYLEASGLADSTDIFVPSDHGHSTVVEQIDVANFLIANGIKHDADSPDVLVATNGGCETIYVPDGDKGKIAAAVELLMQQDWCGPIFTREGIEGTFPMSLILYEHERAPDILMSFAWDANENDHGVAGRFFSSGLPAGRGDHGSLSPYEIRNTLIAAGPHFKRGVLNGIPSGNVDIFPTILSILGLNAPEDIDGRVLQEAFADGPQPQEIFVQTDVHTGSKVVRDVRYSQQIQVSHVGDTLYLDKGRAWRQTVVA